MDVNEDLVRKVAETARLKLTDEEVQKYVPEFQEILALFEKISEVNTENTTPSFIPIDKKNHLREDEVIKPKPKQQMLALSKHTKDDYFKGPKAL